MGGDTESLAGLAVSNAGTVGAVFAVDQRRSDGPMGEPVDALVLPRGAKRFARLQQIGKVGNAAADYEDPNQTAIVPTSRGELVEASADDAGRSASAILSPGHTRFAIRQPASANLAGGELLAPDASGGTYMAGDAGEDGQGCVTAAYRPPHGAFSTRYVTSPCPKRTANSAQGLAAAGDAGAALLTRGGSATTFPLFIQVGHQSEAFSTPVKLTASGWPLPVGGANDYTTQASGPGGKGVAADRNGRVTTAWQGCTTAAQDCPIPTKGIYAQMGTISAGFTHGSTLLAPSRKGTKLSGIVADGAVAWQRCRHKQPCTVSVALAAGSGFGTPTTVTRKASELVGLYGDQHGDLMLVWVDQRGDVYAAVRPASARGFGRSRRVAGPGVSRKTVTGAVGLGGHDIIAWSGRGKTRAVTDDSVR